MGIAFFTPLTANSAVRRALVSNELQDNVLSIDILASVNADHLAVYPRLGELPGESKKYTHLISYNTASIASVLKIRLGLDR